MIKPSLLEKLAALSDRHEELAALLGEAEVIADQTRFRAYSREYAETEPVVQGYARYRKVLADMAVRDAAAPTLIAQAGRWNNWPNWSNWANWRNG